MRPLLATFVLLAGCFRAPEAPDCRPLEGKACTFVYSGVCAVSVSKHPECEAVTIVWKKPGEKP